MSRHDPELRRKNMRILKICLGIVVVMEVGPWLYAPVYRQVCSLLGVRAASDKNFEELLASEREASAGEQSESEVRFMGVAGTLPIAIEPLQTQARVKTGEVFTVMYRLTNQSNRDLDYRAIHSTLPAAHPSFELIKCFCEDHRIIAAGATEEWPVVFRLVKPVREAEGLTLNYTLFDYDPKKNAKSAVR